MTDSLTEKWEQVRRPLGLMVAVAIVVVFVSPILNALIIWGHHRFLFHHASSGLPSVNPYLLKSVVSAIVLSWAGIPTLVRWLKKSRGPTLVHRWVLIALGVSLLWNAVLGIARNDHLFGPDGRAARFFSLRPEGEVYLSYHPGVDPLYGTKLREVTPDLVDAIRHWRIGPPKRMSQEPESFFDTATGQPKVWVSENPDGTWSFFDGPGFDDRTSTVLQPATAQWAAEYRKQGVRREELRKLEILRQQEAEEAQVAEQLRKDRAEASEGRRQEIRSHLEVGRIPKEGGPFYALNLRGEGPSPRIVAGRVQKQLGDAKVIGGFLRDSFFDSAVCRDLLSGNWSDRDDLPKEWERIAAFVVLDSVVEYGSVNLDKDLVRAVVVVKGEVYRPAGVKVSLPPIEGIGAGFSKESARAKAFENLVEAQAAAISEALRGEGE